MKAMHEARSKDELYRKIYHEPERNIGVLRVKLMHSPLFLFSRRLHSLLWNRRITGNSNMKSTTELQPECILFSIFRKGGDKNDSLSSWHKRPKVGCA